MYKQPIGYYYNRFGEEASKVKIYDVRPFSKENFNPMYANTEMYSRDEKIYNQVEIEFLNIPGDYIWINILKSDIVLNKEV